MGDFNEVSLGFAEFVSLLLQETFDATLAAQNHQLEKYAELESALHLSNNRFKELYLNDELLLEKELDIFSVPLKPKMVLDLEKITLIESLFDEDAKNLVYQNKLTKVGALELKKYVLDTLVTERKDMLNGLLNKSEMARLIVDSGEIRAKLELTSFVQLPSHSSENRSFEKKIMQAKDTSIGSSKKGDATQFKEEIAQKQLDAKIINSSIILDGVKMTEILDTATNKRVVIVDKASFSDKLNIKSIIPSARMIAKPVSKSSTSSLFSEVIIRFKTI